MAIARALDINHAAVSRHLQHPTARAALQAAAGTMLDELALDLQTWAPKIARREFLVAMGEKGASSAQVAAMKHLLGLAGLVERQSVTLTADVTVAAEGDPRAPLAAKLAALLPALPPALDDDPDDAPAPESGGGEGE